MRKTLTLIAFFIFIAGCSSQDLSKKEYFEQGRSFRDSGNSNGAILAFKNAIEKDQNYFEARYQLALAYISQNKFESAEKELKKVLRLNPYFNEARVSLAKTYLMTGEPDMAIKEINQYLQNKQSSDRQSNPEVYELAGAAYAAKSDYKMAKEFLYRALKEAPESISSKLTLAKIYMKGDEYSKAESLVKEILETDNKNRNGLYILASVSKQQGNIEDTRKIYQKIIEVNPDEVMAQLELGLSYLRKKEIDKAEESADILIKIHPKRPEGHYLKGLVYFHRQKIDEALISLQNSVNKAEIPGAYYYLGLSYLSKGELEQAISRFQRVVDLNPDMIQAHLLLAITHLKKRRTDVAVKAAQKAVDIDEENAFAHNVLGSAYMAAGKYDLAMEEFDRAIELNPALIDVHLKKGAYNLLSGYSEKAEDEFRNAVEVAPEVLQTRVILAQYYIKQKKFNDAIKVLKEGLKENPNDAVLYNIMGAAHLGKGEADAATEYYEKAIGSNPKFFLPYFNLATLYTFKGHQDKAMNEFKKVLEVDGSNARALIGIALIMEVENKDEEALTYYKKAAEQKVLAAYIALAGYYLRKKDNKKALDVLDEALSFDSKNIKILDLKGSIYQKEKKYKQALAIYRNLKRFAPEQGTARIAGVHESMGEYNKAIEELKGLLTKKADRVDVLAKIAALYIKKKDFKEAEKNAKSIIFFQSDSDFGYRILANVYISDRYFDKGLDSLKKAEELNPANIETQMMIGQAYVSKGSLGKALKVFKNVEKIQPKYAPVYFFQGNIHDRMGNKKDAVEMYKKAVSLSPNFIQALNNLAYLYAEGHGSIDEAVNLAQRAKELAPKNGGVTDTLGWVLFKKENYDDALQHFIEATYYIPGNPTVRYHLALTYMKKGANDKAEKQLENAVRLGNSSNFPELRDAQKILDGLRNQ